MNRISDNQFVAMAADKTSLSGSALQSLAIDTKEFDTFMFVVRSSNINAVPSLDIDVECASSELFTDAESVKAVTGIDPSGNPIVVVDGHADNLVEGKPYVPLNIAETAGGLATVDVQVIKVGENPHNRYENKIGADLRIATWE